MRSRGKIRRLWQWAGLSSNSSNRIACRSQGKFSVHSYDRLEERLPLANNVSGPINSNTVWGDTTQPYVLVGDVTVNAGVTLSILPGVEVRTDNVLNDLIIFGRVDANGMRFTGTATDVRAENGGRLDIYGNSEVAGTEIYYKSGSIGSLLSSTVTSARIRLESTGVAIDGNTFTGNTPFQTNPGLVPQFFDNSFTVPATAEIVGTMTGNATWAVIPNLSNYEVAGDIVVPSGLTLTIPSGITIRTDNSLSDIEVNGFLNVDGVSFVGNQTDIRVAASGRFEMRGGSSFSGSQLQFAANSLGVIENNSFSTAMLEVLSSAVVVSGNIFSATNPITTNPSYVPEFYDNTFGVQATIDLVGSMTSNAVWQVIPNLKNYRVASDIFIPNGLTLTIPAQIEITTDNSLSDIEVSGFLDVSGGIFLGLQTDIRIAGGGRADFRNGTSIAGAQVVYAVGSLGVIENTTFTSARLDVDSSGVVVSSSTFSRTDPVITNPSYVPDLYDNTFNVQATIDVRGTATFTATWQAITNVVNYRVLSTINIASGVTLTIQPGINVVTTNSLSDIDVLGTLVVQGSSFSGNETDIDIASSGRLIATDSSFAGNEVYFFSGTLGTLTNCLFSSATLRVESTGVQVNGCTFSGTTPVMTNPSLVPEFYDNTFSVPATIEISGTLASPSQWRVIPNLRNFRLYGDVRVPAGLTWTLPAGIEILTDNSLNDIDVAGTLQTTAVRFTGSSTQITVESGGQIQMGPRTIVAGSQVVLQNGSIGAITNSDLRVNVNIHSGSSVVFTENIFASGTVTASGPSTGQINLVNQFWGTTDLAVIEGKITHKNDNANLPLVSFAPPLANAPLGFVSPYLSAIANRVIPQNQVLAAVEFSVYDTETAANALIVSATSSNTALIPNSGLVITGTDVVRSLAVTPQANQSGVATITVSASDGVYSSSVDFTVTVINAVSVVGNTLTVTGSELDDAIFIDLGTELIVTWNGYNFPLPAAGIQNIVVNANGGNDVVEFTGLTGGMQVTADGGLGDDRLQASSSVFAAMTLRGQDGSDTLIGGSGNDTLTGGLGNDQLTGGAGNDRYQFNSSVASGQDTLIESTGIDTLDFTLGSIGISIDLGQAAVQTYSPGNQIILNSATAFENVFGTDANDLLIGNSSNNTLQGRGGNDRYVFNSGIALGNDTLIDTAGLDTLDFSSGSTGVTLNLGLTSAQNYALTSTLALASATAFENLIGSQGNDNLTGNSINNIFEGRGGNDRYNFNSSLANGNDIVIETAGVDTVDFSSGTTGITFNLGITAAQFYAGSSSLSLISATAIENLIGTNAADILEGNTLGNLLDGRGGDDQYRFNTSQSLGSDLLSDTGGIDTLDFSSGATPIVVSLGTTAVQTYALGLQLTLSSSSAWENLIGTAGNDTLTGNDLNNILNGAAGDDTYVFSSHLALGTDTITDASGVDTLNFASGTTGVTVDLSIAVAQFYAGSNQLNLSSAVAIENIIGTDSADTLTGNSLNNRLEGRGGDDRYQFNSGLSLGSDTLIETTGVDTLDFSSGTVGISIDLAVAGAQTYAAGKQLTLSQTNTFENVIGTNSNDTLSGNELNNLLQGLAGNDTYRFNTNVVTGSDTLVDTSGLDTLDFSPGNTAITLNLGLASVQQLATSRFLTLSSETAFENVIGTSGNDVLTGNALNNVLDGRGGNDRYVFAGSNEHGTDTLLDTAGIDTVDFSGFLVGINFDLSKTTSQATAGASSITLGSGTAFENLSGTDLDDVLSGNTVNNQLDGRGGNDRFVFQSQLASGSDTIVDSTGIDTLDFSLGSVGVAVNLGITTLQTWAGANQLMLNSAAAIENVLGSSGNDFLTGNSLNNILDGRGGNDELIGAAGNDTYRFPMSISLGSDIVTDLSGTDTLDFSNSTVGITRIDLSSAAAQTISNFLNLTLVNAATTMEHVVGTDLIDTFVGNALNNDWFGGGGNDVYLFNADLALGSDRIFDSGGWDRIDFSQGLQKITIDLGSTASQVINSNLTLTLGSAVSMEGVNGSGGNDIIYGNALANRLSGGARNDILVGRGGDDDLLGGAGSDRYVFDADEFLGTDKILNETACVDFLDFQQTTGQSIAIDLGQAALQVVVPGRLSLVLGNGAIIEAVRGGGLNDTITGNSLANILIGMGGDDQLRGLGGRDLLIGGLGADQIFGGAGEDLLIAGSTTHDTNLASLSSIHAVWNSADTYANRINRLRAGTNVPRLAAGVTVLNDTSIDSLLGEADLDWYFASLTEVGDLAGGEVVDV